MRESPDLDSLAALEEIALSGVSTRNDTPRVILRSGPAGNDATCEDPATSENHAEQWDWRAFAPHAPGDVEPTDAESSSRPTSLEMYHAARAHRSFTLGEIIIAAIQAAGAIVRQAYARYRQRRHAKATYDALRQLDDRMLRDLGFDRSEMTSVAAEASGEAEYTRVRALYTSHGFPK